MSSRRPAAGWRRGSGISRSRNSYAYQDEEYEGPGGRRTPSGRPGAVAASAVRGVVYEHDEEESAYSSRRSKGFDRPARSSIRGSRAAARAARSVREPFFASAGERRTAVSTDGIGSSLVRHIAVYDREAAAWLRTEEGLSVHINRIIRAVESLEERLRTESYNGYSGNVWEADDPISNAVKEKYQELQSRLMELLKILEKPSVAVVEEMSDGFYLLLSVMHVLLLNREVPEFCEETVANIMAAGALIGMNHGDSHMVLTCTTDHLRDSETDSVLLAFQYVLYKVIDGDTDGTKLFGTAHKVLDAQMDILETRDDENIAVSALNIIGAICVRHPQAFKTRFWDIMDLFFGWYVDAMPTDRVFEACVLAFGLFKEKFKQEIDWAFSMAKQFTVDMEDAVVSYQNAGKDKTGATHHQAAFLALFQLFALVHHAVAERIRGSARIPVEIETRQAVKANMTSIFKAFNQILQASNPGFAKLAERVNRTLIVVITALGSECTTVSSSLILYARMLQTSTFRLHSALKMHEPLIDSLFRLVATIIRSIGEHFPREAAKDLLGPDSLLFAAARYQIFVPSLRSVVEALITYAAAPVKDFVLRSFAADYRRTMMILVEIHKDPNRMARLRAPINALTSFRKPASDKLFEQDRSVSPTDPLAKMKSLCGENKVFLLPDGMEDDAPPSDIPGVTNMETSGQIYRERAMVHLFLTQLCLVLDQPIDQEFVDGCYAVLMNDMDDSWSESFPEVLIGHIHVAKALWQKKCASLVVKELMKTSHTLVSVSAADKEFIRATLRFLDGIMAGDQADIVLPIIMEWTNDALRTLVAFNAPLKSLEIEVEYITLVHHFMRLSWGPSPHDKTAAKFLSDLFITHWEVLKSVIPDSMLEKMFFICQLSSVEMASVGETILQNSSLQNVLRCTYFPAAEKSSEEIFPSRSDVNKWKSVIFQNTSVGNADPVLIRALMELFMGLRFGKRMHSEIRQLIPDTWEATLSEAVAHSEDLGYYYVINQIANSICHQKMPGILSSLDNALNVLSVLAQVYAPIILDHNNFVHKSLLELYIGMKDVGLDVVDEWDELKRNAVEKAEDGNEIDVPVLNTQKAAEKRRIYSKLGGITANDVTAPKLSWLDTQIQLYNILQFAEGVEKSLERMLYGSALFASALNDADWTIHMKLVKELYSSEKHLEQHQTTLKTLRNHMLRIAMITEDDYLVARLGYPVLVACMQDGIVSGIDVEKLAVTLLWSLLHLQSTYLVRNLSGLNEMSEVETGVSQKCFDIAKCMVDQRYDHALEETNGKAVDGLTDDAFIDLDYLESELRAECFAKLNNWKGLSNLVDECDSIGPRAEQWNLLSSLNSPESSFTEETFSNTLEHIRQLLNGDKLSRLNGSEMAAYLVRSEIQTDVTQEALDSLRDLQKLEMIRGIPKICSRTSILLHALERTKMVYGADDLVSKFPLASNPPLDIRGLDISTQHTACRWLCGSHRFVKNSMEIEACWDPELFLSVVKFGRKTENSSLVYGYLKDYFGTSTISDDEDDSSDSTLDKFEMLSVTLAKLLLKASETTSSFRDLNLVREGVKFLVDCGEFGARSRGVDVAQHICLSAFRITQEAPDTAGHCLVEVAKTLQGIGDLHRSAIGFAEDEAYRVQKSVGDATAIIRFHMDAMYTDAGFAPGMFVENPSFSGFMTPSEITSGLLAELAYMAHCMEGMYTKPAILFGNWCYQQAYRMLTSLSKMLPEDIVTSLNASLPDVDLSHLSPGIISHIVQCYMDNLPLRVGRQTIRAVVDILKEVQESVEVMAERVAADEGVPLDGVSAVFDYCRHHFTEVVEFFVQATHVYFVYLRRPKGSDYAAVVINRLMEMLTAFPDTLHSIWMEELPKHDVVIWKEFVPQLLGRLHHPNHLVGQCMMALISALVARFPNDMLYSLTVGRMMAFDENIGGGACVPGLNAEQIESLQRHYGALTDGANDVLGNLVEGGTVFATEIQRISLLSEERWMHFLLSQQTTIKKQIRTAIKEALAFSNGTRDESIQEDDSITEDVRTPYSDMDLNFDQKSSSVFSDEFAAVNPFCDLNELRKENAELVIQSREGTPDENENQREDIEEEWKKPGKHYIRFQTYASQSWKTAFRLPLYQKSIEAIYQQLVSLLELSIGEAVTPAEAEFVGVFRNRLSEAIQLLYNPPARVEFDEDFIWAPFGEILTMLEERHSGKRRGSLAVNHITVLPGVLSRWTSLPIPGLESSLGNVVTIAAVEAYVDILPTKTKPKKLVFRGNNGKRYAFLCKGLEDLSQDARIMQFLNVSDAFLRRSLKAEKSVPRVRTYSVIPFGPRAGLIQWVGESTSLLTLYRSHLERESFLGRQIFAVNEDNFVDVPVYGQIKTKNDAAQQNLTFRVAEEELQDLYENIQDMKADATLSEDRKSSARSDKVEDNTDFFDKWVDSEDEFSPLEFTEAYYDTVVRKTKKDLEKLQQGGDDVSVRVHPNLHELYMSYLVKSLRKDSSIAWDKFRLHEQNRTKNIDIVHLRNALESLMKITPSDLLAREIWLACSSSEEHWRVSRSFAQSLAMTSILGYIIGLGDRHPDNVLFDFHTGEVIHVDYNVSFEKGLRLSVPERVPYRLTPNLVTALGHERITGTFRDFALKTLETLRKNQSVLSLLVSSYVTDPLIDWTTDKNEALGVGPVKRRSNSDDSETDEKAELFSLKVWTRIREKLLGLDGIDGNRLDVSSQVDRTITLATDPNNLARMFEGWVAWV